MKTYDHGYEDSKDSEKSGTGGKNSARSMVLRYVESLSQEQIYRMIDTHTQSRFIKRKDDPTGREIMRRSMEQNGFTIQAKLEISTPEDAHEKQADDLANAVSENNTSKSQNILNEKPADVQTKGESGSLTTTPEFDQQLSATKGQGQSLDDTTKEKLEQHTGTDLSDVKIHTGSTASSLSEGINAKAFTHGQDIYFKDGNYDPKSPEGEKLLSHEVAHTVQQGDGVGRKVMRKEVDVTKKDEFHALDSPETFLVTQVTGLRSDNSLNSTYELILYPNDTVKISHLSEDWYYGACLGAVGYIQIAGLVRMQELDQVQISGEIFKGDLNNVAAKIKLWYEQTQKNNFWGDWSSGMSKKREELLNAIPPDMSIEQRDQLEQIMADKYQLSLKNILYIGFGKDLAYKDNPELFKALLRVNTKTHTEIANIKLEIPENDVIALGAEPIYRVGLTFPYTAYYLPPSGMYELKDWMVMLPDGEVESHRVSNDLIYSFSNPDRYKYEVEMDQVGIYRVGAVVSYNGQIDLLSHYVQVKNSTEIAREHADQLGDLDPGAFNKFRMQYVVAANVASLKMSTYAEKGLNEQSKIQPVAGENPIIVHAYQNGQNFSQLFKLNTKTDSRIVWYVIPDNQNVLPIQHNTSDFNYFFGDYKGATEHDLPDGKKAYSPYKELKPQKQSQITLPFPGFFTANFLDQRFRVIAEEYDQYDNLTAVSEYYQYFRGADTDEYKQLKAERDAANEQLNRLNKYSAKISGDVNPVKAIYLNEETGNSLQIQLFYGTDKTDDTKVRLLDLTIGVEKSDYTGDDLADALDSYDYRNSYPDGTIYVYLNETPLMIETNGGSLVERFTTWSGWLSTLAFAGGVVAMFAGLEPLALGLFKVGLVAGAITSLGNIYDQLDKDKVNIVMIAVEVFSIASIIASKAATSLRLVAKANNSLRAARNSSRLFAVAGFLDGGGVFLMTTESMGQMNTVLDDKSLSDQERQSKLMMLLSGMLLNGVFFAFSHEDVISTKNELKKKGLPEGKLAALDEVQLLKVNQLTKEEIEQALKEGEDLIAKAEMKEEKMILQNKRKDVDDLFINHKGDILEDVFKDTPAYKKLSSGEGVSLMSISEHELQNLENIKSKNNIEASRNVATLETLLMTKTKKANYVAHSSFDNFESKIPNGSPSPKESKRIFKTHDAPTEKGKLIARNNDAEVKMLEELATELGAKPGDYGIKTFADVKGTIIIKSELVPCGSCSEVILQFKKLFPNIDIKIFAQPKISF